MLVATIITAGLTLSVGADASQPLEAWVPPDAMVAYVAHPSDRDALQGAAHSNQLSTWMLALSAAGAVPEQGRILAEAVATFPLLDRRDHAITLLDITAKPLENDSYRLNELRVAMILKGTDDAAEIDRRVRDLLRGYTNADIAQVEAIQSNGARYFRLIDKRLPAWAVIEWGTAHGCYLLGFGEGVLDRLLKTKQDPDNSLSADDWFLRAEDACHGRASLMTCYVNFQRLKARLSEVIKDRPEEVLQTLHLGDVRRLYWTLGFDGKSLRSEVFTDDVNDKTRYLMLAGRELAEPGVAPDIPDAASGYGIIRVPLAGLYGVAKDAWFKSKSEQWREERSRLWHQLETQYGFDLEDDIVSQLGDHLVIHTWPRHPLGMPGLWTMWIQHRGQREQLAESLDRFMQVAQWYLQRRATQQKKVLLTPQIKREDDGIWYLKFGIVGPAVGVANRWIVVSFSPNAVRKNIEHLRSTNQP